MYRNESDAIRDTNLDKIAVSPDGAILTHLGCVSVKVGPSEQPDVAMPETVSDEAFAKGYNQFQTDKTLSDENPDKYLCRWAIDCPASSGRLNALREIQGKYLLDTWGSVFAFLDGYSFAAAERDVADGEA